MIPSNIRIEIVRRIRAAEAEHHVRVLLAVESGSRAWGFASPDSDYDARFIYAHPRDWYLSVENGRDVIEYGIADDIDLSGWEIRKALRLFGKSNPAFVEWIQSPIVYLQEGRFTEQVRRLLPTVYLPESGIHHYRSMARTNFRPFEGAELVPLKKYFYVLRPLLAIRWLERHRTAAPIEFESLLPLISDDRPLLADITALLERKRAAPELGLEPAVHGINAFIEAEFERLGTLAPVAPRRDDALSQLNDVFRDVLRE